MLGLLLSAEIASAFCGTYAGTAGTSLTNQTSQMVVAIQDGRSTLTVWSDYQGSLSDFALLIPVPAGLLAEQVDVVDRTWVEELSVFSSPRLATYTCADALAVYHDGPSVNGCGLLLGCSNQDTGRVGDTAWFGGEEGAGAAGTVAVEASFTAGEYALTVLSAEQGQGLIDWLADRDFELPPDPDGVIQGYIDAGSWFLAAEVQLSELPGGRTWLSPIQIRYDDDSVEIPIVIGTLSSEGSQDLILYTVADSEVEIVNYDEVELDRDCMARLDDGQTLTDYHDLKLDTLTDARDRAGWTLEHSWALSAPVKCDPCTPSDSTYLLSTALPGLGYQTGLGTRTTFPSTPSEPTDTGRTASTDYYGYGYSYGYGYGYGYPYGYGYGYGYTSNPGPAAHITRLRMRFRPDQVDQDLVLNPLGFEPEDRPLQTRYITYDRQLENLFPVCDEGWAEDPGQCDPSEIGGAARRCNTAPAPAPLAGLLVIAVAWRRRR